jgi:hypothetical protein
MLRHAVSYILKLASLAISYVGAVFVVHTEDIPGDQSCCGLKLTIRLHLLFIPPYAFMW